MARIRHIAIYAENPNEMAAFYIEAFDLKEVKEKSERSNLLIRRLYQCCAFGAAKRCDPKGLHHFGFEVDTVEATEKRLKEIKPDIEIEQPPRHRICRIQDQRRRRK